MRIVILTTGTNNVPHVIDPLKTLGHDVHVFAYDEMTPAQHENDLLGLVSKHNPDFVVYVGAIPEHYNKPVPKTHQLARIGEKFKLVHLCFDGAEVVWWPHLIDYYANGRFALQVSIDGMRKGPIGDRGLTLLCPIDSTAYTNPDWSERCINFGFRGGLHGGRNQWVRPLVDKALLTFSPRDSNGDHAQYARFLSMCRVVLNVAVTGGPSGNLHVKARVLEAAASGCLVLETRDSPLKDWFDAGLDYFEYTSAEEAAAHAQWACTHTQAAQAMAERLRTKVIERHSPAVFWSQVMERLGFGEALVPVKEAPYQCWTLHTDSSPVMAGEPILLETRAYHNFVAFHNRVYIIPQALGTIDLTNSAHRARPGVLNFATLREARERLNGR